MVVDKSEKNSNFDKINELYSQYLDLKKKTDSNDTNNKYFVAFKIIKEKLIIEIYNRYVNLDEKIIDIKGHDIPKNIYANEDNYSDIIVEEILYSLETYETFVNDKEKYAFSKYVCMRINNSKGSFQILPNTRTKVDVRNIGTSLISNGILRILQSKILNFMAMFLQDLAKL